MNSVPLVSVVLVTYNGRHLLERFTSSIVAQDYPNLEYIVVITETGDGSADWIHQTYPHWKIVQHKENDGASADYNRGIHAARGELIFGISNDMWFEPDCISKLVARMQSDPTLGVCTCKVLRMTPDGEKTNVIDNMGGKIDFLGCAQAIAILQEDHGQWDHVKEAFFAYGGILMIRKSLFDQVGGYDNDAFAQGDDIDLCWRIHLLGYKVAVEPSAVLYHRVSTTLSKVPRGQLRFWGERNTLRMLLKNYSVFTLLWVLPCYTVLLFTELIFYLCMRRWDISSRVLSAARWNFTHWAETLKSRRSIQSQRKISDWKILQQAMKFPWKLRVGLNFLRDPQAIAWKSFFGIPMATTLPSGKNVDNLSSINR